MFTVAVPKHFVPTEHLWWVLTINGVTSRVGREFTTTRGGKPMEPYAGKASGTLTFSTPGDYVVHVTLNDFSEKGGGATGCCWTTAMVTVKVNSTAGARLTGQQ